MWENQLLIAKMAVEVIPMPKLDDQISTLQERLKQLKLRQQHVDARRRALDTQRERKAQIRRSILVGTVILAKMEEGTMDAKLVQSWLDQYLTRSDDRALFDMPPRAAGDGVNV